MADIEYLAAAFFFFDIDRCPGFVVKKISGLAKEMKVAASDVAIGSMAKGKAQTQATPGIVSYSSALTVEFVCSNDGEQQKLIDWYKACHANAFSGGGTKGRESRDSASLYILDGGSDTPAVEIVFTDCFPENLTQIDEMSVEKAGEAAIYKLDLRFTNWDWES